MGVFSRFFGDKNRRGGRGAESSSEPELVPPTPGQATTIEAVPGRVEVDFHVHATMQGQVGNFLTAVTRGLHASGQRELVLTMRLGNREGPSSKMRELVRFFAAVHTWAGAGRLVDAGSVTQFAERGLFGVANCGLLYADAQMFDDVELPDGALSAIFVDADEIRLALECGNARVLTRLGEQFRIFPFPAWSTIERSSAATSKEFESLLWQTPKLHLQRASFVVADHRLCLSIPNDEARVSDAIRTLPPDTPFALLTRVAKTANAALVWRPGQQEMLGISPEGSNGSRLSGCFVLFTRDDKDDYARPFGDGYVVLLGPEAWTMLVAALVEQQPLSVKLKDGLHFALEWHSVP